MTSKSNRPCIAVLAAFFTTTAFAQDNQGTPEQRAACALDAFRLCSRYVPDAAKVENCLRQNAADLSDACQLVFEQSAGQQKQMSDWRRYSN
jgi:hypothetical protein